MFDITLKSEDIGPRLQHLFELHELWSWALHIRTRGTYRTPIEIEQAKKLEIALEMLSHVLMGYEDPSIVPSVINSLPKDAREIKNDIPIT